jgi:hypothetical protein
LVISAEPAMMETAGGAALVVADRSPARIADALASAMNRASARRLAAGRKRRLAELRKLADGHLILEAVEAARRAKQIFRR